MTDVIDRFAQGVVETMDRRRFLRRAARGAFVVLALGTTASGRQVLRSSLGQMVVKGDTCSGPGSGCPGAAKGNPCGSSRCCNFIRSGAPNNCDCSVGSNSTTCKTNSPNSTSTTSPNCYGRDSRFYSSSPVGCWTCVYCNTSTNTRWTTTCCDCKTNKSNCNDPNVDGTNRGRCIAFHSTSSNC